MMFNNFFLNICWIKSVLTVEVNGKNLMSKEIREVTGTVNLLASPERGRPPASGTIRATTVIRDEDYGGASHLQGKSQIHDLTSSLQCSVKTEYLIRK